MIVAICCVSAMAVAGGISVLLPARYTATASILIEPPAGNDPRGATAEKGHAYVEATVEKLAGVLEEIATFEMPTPAGKRAPAPATSAAE